MGKSTGEVGKLSHFEFLGKFDSTLEKATRIAGKRDPNDASKVLYGEESWILIIEFLHKYMLQSLENLLKNFLKSVDLKDRI